jgi:hypothetical protein
MLMLLGCEATMSWELVVGSAEEVVNVVGTDGMPVSHDEIPVGDDGIPEDGVPEDGIPEERALDGKAMLPMPSMT